MSLLDLDRRAITRARGQLAAAREAQREARAQHHAAQAELARMASQGAGPRALAAQRERVDGLAGRAREQAQAARGALGGIVELSEALRAQRDPSLLVRALDTQHPVLLMPVSIQTRYDDATTRLMSRIYPDVLHGVQHQPGLTPKEIEAAKRYWAQRFANPQDTASPWQDIAIPYGPMRAAYLVRATQPTNLAQLGQADEPAFSDASIPQAAPDAREVVAAALPDRFVAVGFRGGVEVLRKWGGPVADLLPMSPLFDPLLVEDPEQWDPFADDRAWLVDYPAAVQAGMAITVTQADLTNGALLADGLDRLVVLGVDWTQTPDSAAELVADLLANHQHGQGLKFVPQGTPTNNTAGARAAFAAGGADIAAAMDPVAADAQAQAIAEARVEGLQGPGVTPVVADELAGAGARLTLLLGLPGPGDDGAGFDAATVPGADLQEGATAGHMQNALWNATLGYTLRWFWNPLDPARTLLDDDALSTLRAHVVRYLRPGGALGALRVGNQPYGILPITARGFVPEARSALERELLDVLQWLRGFWQAASGTVPTMRVPAAHQLHQVLATQPWCVAKNFWHVVGPVTVANQPELKALGDEQRKLVRLVVRDLLGAARAPDTPYLAECVVKPKAHSLDALPWVQADDDHPRQELPPEAHLKRDYLQTLRDLLAQPQSAWRAALLAMQNGESLLEAMMAFAADEELLDSSRRFFRKHLELSPLVSAEARQLATRARYAEYVGVDTATAVGDQVDFGRAGNLLALQLTGTTGASNVEAFVGSHFGGVLAQWPEQLRNVASFRDSLDFLQTRTVGELDMALRGTLDLASHRLDAWISSLATKRLDQMREARPQGLHIGAFGVVEDLRPDSRLPVQRAADSLGYVHAPSLQQATTAAILRSGHLANREHAGGAFDLDLRSRRVRRARALLEGVARGQSLAALLGYRFERGLRDADLSPFILDYRLRYPLNPTGPAAAVGESVAARDVIDGVALIGAYQQAGKSIDAVSPATVPPAERPKVKPFVEDLIDLMDSVSDLLVGESVHQIVGGNLEAAGAAMGTLDKQTRPPEPRVVDTPHSTRGYSQRVAVLTAGSDAGAWAPMEDLAAQAEPRLNAWLARLLGAPGRWHFKARVLKQVDSGQRVDGRPQMRWDDTGGTLACAITELGLSPLTLVLGSEAERGGGASRVQQAIAAVLKSKAAGEDFGAPAKDLAIVLQGDAPADAPAGSVGLVAFESCAWLLRRLLDKVRPLRRMDMVLARDGIESAALLADGEYAGVDAAELAGRLAQVDARADLVLQALADAIAPVPAEPETLDAAAPATQAMLADLRAALAQADALGWRSALTGRAAAGAIGSGEQVDEGDTVAAAVERAQALHAEITLRREAAPPPAAGDSLGTQVRSSLARMRAVLGVAFPALPVFTLGGYAAEANAALARRAELLQGDELAIAGWLPKLGCVHEPTGLLNDALTAAEALGVPTAGADLQLLQYAAPFSKPDQRVRRWGALPPDPEDDLRGVVAVVLHAPGGLAAMNADDGLAGFFVDEWSESIPSPKETTGLSFHFDAPGARAPQSMLLAVPHDKGVPSWTLEALLGVVDEALALARLRAVRPQDLSGLGLLLPGIYLSNNFHRDAPTLDFAALMEKSLFKLRAAYGQNSTKSYMTMAAGTSVPTE